MIGCLRTRIRKQPIIALYFESENELKFYNLEADFQMVNGAEMNPVFEGEYLIEYESQLAYRAKWNLYRINRRSNMHSKWRVR